MTLNQNRLRVILNALALLGGHNLLDKRLEGGHVGDGQFAQHLAVDFNALLGEGVDEPAVLDTALLASGGDSNDPLSAEIAFFGSAVTKGILP